MSILQVIWFYALMLFVPLGIGKLIFPEKRAWSPVVYPTGLLTIWALYEIIGVPCAILFKTKLTTLTVLWSIIVAVLAVLGCRSAWKKRGSLGAAKLELSKVELALAVLICLVIVFETARAATGYVLAWDDSDYVAQATTSLYTNTINQYEPQTGVAVELLEQREPHHKIALWSIFWASVTHVTGIHPAILMRTLFSVIFYPCVYAVVYLTLKELFENNREKALTGLLLIQLFYEAAACGAGQKQWWFLQYNWYGKTVTAMLICPFLYYLFLLLQKEQDKRRQHWLWLLTALTAWAGCLVAASAFLMVPFLLGVLGIAHFIQHRDFPFCIKLGCCMLPCLVLYYITK